MKAQYVPGNGCIAAAFPLFLLNIKLPRRTGEMLDVSVWAMRKWRVYRWARRLRMPGPQACTVELWLTPDWWGGRQRARWRENDFLCTQKPYSDHYGMNKSSLDSKISFRRSWSHLELMKFRIPKMSPWEFWGNLKITHASSPVNRGFSDCQNPGAATISWVGLIWLYLSWG